MYPKNCNKQILLLHPNPNPSSHTPHPPFFLLLLILCILNIFCFFFINLNCIKSIKLCSGLWSIKLSRKWWKKHCNKVFKKRYIAMCYIPYSSVHCPSKCISIIPCECWWWYTLLNPLQAAAVGKRSSCPALWIAYHLTGWYSLVLPQPRDVIHCKLKDPKYSCRFVFFQNCLPWKLDRLNDALPLLTFQLLLNFAFHGIGHRPGLEKSWCGFRVDMEFHCYVPQCAQLIPENIMVPLQNALCRVCIFNFMPVESAMKARPS